MPDREFESPLTEKMLSPLKPDCKYVRISGALTDQEYRAVAELLAERPDVMLSISDHSGYSGNLNFLRYLRGTRSINISAYYLKDWEGLQFLPQTLTTLWLLDTRSRRVCLRFLERLPYLRELYIEGQSKDIEVIASLSRLEDLTLRSLTLPGLDFLVGLEKLSQLDIKLGGTRNLDALPRLHSVRYLELWMIRGLDDITPVGEMTELEELFLEDQKPLTRLPDMSKMKSLKKVTLSKMKGLTDLRPLVSAPALEEIVVRDSHQLKIDDYACLCELTTLKSLIAGDLVKTGKVHRKYGLPLPAGYAEWERDYKAFLAEYREYKKTGVEPASWSRFRAKEPGAPQDGDGSSQ